MIKCHYCSKPRLIFSKLKVSPNITLKFKKETSDLFYICDTSIEELSSKEVYNVLHVKKNLTCEDSVESIYNTLSYDSICVHCGTTKRLSTATNEYPMCSGCHCVKKKPVLRRKVPQKKKWFVLYFWKVFYIFDQYFKLTYIIPDEIYVFYEEKNWKKPEKSDWFSTL